MRKIFALILLSIILTSCGVSIDSVVDKNLNRVYYKPLIVIPYEPGATRNFSNKLKEKLEIILQEEGKKADFIIFPKENNTLELNQGDAINERIGRAIVNGDKDILLIFKPTHLQFMDGGLQSATYELVGIDVNTKKEIWKAKFNSSSSWGPALFAEKSAQVIFDKLREDRVM